jgi:hypothetical protein
LSQSEFRRNFEPRPNWREFASKGFYFIGDSAYAIKSFLIPPFNDVVHGTAEDNFNFLVECAFGEIELRWGILWRPLQCSLAHNCQIIDACMRLHNFIVEYRESAIQSGGDEMDIFDEECSRFLAFNPDKLVEIHGGKMDDRLDEDGNRLVGGRPNNDDVACSSRGKSLRAQLPTVQSYCKKWIR